MPSTRTVEENRKVTSSYSVTPTHLQVVSHGVAQHLLHQEEIPERGSLDSQPTGDGTVAPDEAAVVRLVAANCPEFAVEIVDE